MSRVYAPYPRQFWRSPLFWLAVVYVLVGIAYASVTPMLEKPDEEGHYGYIRYLREQRRLPPLHSSDPWLAESKQPPLYYVLATLLTGWLPDIEDDGRILVLNRYMDFSVPGYRIDNRNQFLHPPHMTPVVFGARLFSLGFGLATMLVSYWLARQLSQPVSSPRTEQPASWFPPAHADAAGKAGSRLVPLAVAAVVGFHPKFLYIATAVNNDAAIVFISTLVIALLVHRLRRGGPRGFPVLLGGLLGLASVTKVSGLVLLPLAVLGLLFIYAPVRTPKEHRRGVIVAFFRDVGIILVVVVLIGGWWYARNGLLYGDPLTVGVHTSEGATSRPLLDRLGHDLTGIEHTFWANPARTFVSETRLDQVSIWWGRISMGLLIVGVVLNWSKVRANLPTFALLLSWPVTFLFLLVVYWNQKFRWPFGRLLFPAILPWSLLLVWGWQLVGSRRWRRPIAAVGGATLVVVSALIPFLNVYPLYHPWRDFQGRPEQGAIDTLYADAETGEPIAKLVGYTLSDPYALPGTFLPVELCWEPLGKTQVPYAMFVQLLDLSQLNVSESPSIWGRRETYPGLGNLPTDRWPLHETFCDTIMTWVYPEAPTPLGAVIEVGLLEPDTSNRLQPMDAQGNPLSLPYVGAVSVLSRQVLPMLTEPDGTGRSTLYTLDSAIGLDQVEVTQQGAITVTLTWQSLRPVAYDATTFVHLIGQDGEILSQVDHQPLNGRFPTSFWLPGQVVTDVVGLALMPGVEENVGTLQIGMYTWPKLERLPVVDAEGIRQPNDVIVVDIPAAAERSVAP